MAKENDLLFNQLQNPMFTSYDFKQVGLDINNTSLEDKEVYKNLDFVKNNQLLQTDGAFDEAKFDVLYKTALSNYNEMAQNKVGEDIGAHAAFFRDNIYAPVEKRTGLGSVNYEINRVANPMRRQTSVSRIDAITESPLSVREIAQTQRVWDNKTNSWQDSPNDDWWGNWTNTRVLAQWDEEGDHIDPVTGEMMHHQKGDKKLNDAGTYYYENLNGRSVYGREVLSKFDTLTTDGSAWNKFDIFDSDDKKKSITGTMVKSALKVVPAFIPVVGPWYLGMRVGINTLGLMGTLGNMITGGDVDFFNGLEGFTKSMNTSQSDWVTGGVAGTEGTSTAHAWSLESMIGMAADVFTQLQEQRWLFKYPMKMIKGEELANVMYNEKAKQDWITKKTNERLTEFKKLLDVNNISPDDLSKIAFFENPAVGKLSLLGGRQQMAMNWAEAQLNNAITDYQKIGKLISMAYMTGVTVQDAYGEALQEGATPIEAALLTLGYATGEYALINSDLGRWILPELSQKKNMWQQAMKVKAAQGLSEDVLKSTDKVAKSKFVTNMLKLGKNQGALYQYMRSAGKNDFTQATKLTVRAAISNAMGEGVEETSEELLYDMAKSLANVYYSLSGKDTRLSAFDGGDMQSIFNRYALSFVGGTIGGALGELHPEFQAASALHKMSVDRANEILLQVVKEGHADDFIRTIKNVTWAPTDLGFEVDEDGNFKPVKDKKDSQDAIIKQNMIRQVEMIQQILNAEGASFQDEEVMKKISGSNDPAKDLRFAALRKSHVATKYLESYNQVLSDLVKDRLALNGLKQVNTDSKEKQAEELDKRNEEITKLEAKITLEEQQLQDFLSGKKSVDFIKRSLFEMSTPLSGVFPNTTRANYLEGRYHKKVSELTPEELKIGEEDWEKLHEMKGADLIMQTFDIFEDANIKATQLIRDHAARYFDKTTAVGMFSELLQDETHRIVNINPSNSDANDIILGQAESKYTTNLDKYSFDADPMVKLILSLSAKAERIGIDVSDYRIRLKEAIDSLSNGTKTKAEVAHDVENIVFDTSDAKSGILNNEAIRNFLVSEIKDAPFIKENARDAIKQVLNAFNPDESPELNDIFRAINENTHRSPIMEFLDKFSTATKVTTVPVTISKLLEELEKQAKAAGNADNFDQFGFSEGFEEALNNAYKVLSVAEAVVGAARTDAAKWGDVYGYNKTINELDSNSDLAEIDSNTANVILQDIREVEEQLLYYQRLADVISGNKLSEHERTQTQVGALLYNTLVTRIIEAPDFPPDDWNRDSINKLKTTLSKNSEDFNLLRSLTQNSTAGKLPTVRALSTQEQVEFQREMKIMEGALYEFFQENADSVNNTEKLAKFLSASVWGTMQLDTSILTKNSTSLSSAMVWWLASIAAGDPEAFHSAYAKSWDSESGVAPVVGQELATRLAIGALTNGKVFAQFAAAQNLAVRQYIEANKDDADIKKNFYKDDGSLDMPRVLDSDVSIDFLRTILIDGIAGSGKSKGVLKQIISIIDQDKDLANALFSNVWITHTTKEKAYELAVDTFGEERAKAMKDTNCFSHAGLMQMISGTNAEGKTWNETTDDQGNVVIDTSTMARDENGVWGYNFGINKTVTKPSLIITDEVSHISLPSLKLIDKFAEYAGIHHLTFGDFDQTGISLEFNSDGETLKPWDPVAGGTHYEAYAHNTNFIRSFKLGQSLRTDNRLKDANNAQARTLVAIAKEQIAKDAKNAAIPETARLALQYSINDTLDLTGDKFEDIPDTPEKLATFKAQVKHLLDVTKATPGAKLGYIYTFGATDEITQMMREFNNSDEYKGLIDFKIGSAAQGDENPYYIVNVTSGNGTLADQAALIYTALTRAKTGSIIIRNSFTEQFIQDQRDYHAQPTAPKFKLSSSAIKDFITRKRSIYKDIYTEDKPIVFKRYTTSNTAPSVTSNTALENVEVPTGYPGKGVLLIDDDGTKYKVIQYNKDEKGVYSAIVENVDSGEKTTLTLSELSKLNKFSEETRQGSNTENVHIISAGDISNSNPAETQMEHHSFNVDETGLVEDDESYSFGENVVKTSNNGDKPRLDNVIGLINILQRAGVKKIGDIDIANFDFTKKYKKNSKTGQLLTRSIQVVRAIRSVGRYAKSEADILNSMYRIIRDNLGVDISTAFVGKPVVRFAQKICQDFTRNGGSRPRFTRSAKERVQHLIRPGKVDSSELIQNLTVMIIIDADGKELMEIPICCDTNPITLAYTEGFGKVTLPNGKTVDITSWVTDARKRILSNASIAQKDKYMVLVNELTSALTTGELKDHPQAGKLLKELNFFISNGKGVGGKLLFLTTNIGGKEEWLIPGRDWKNTGVIINNDPNFTAMDLSQDRYAHYEGEWISYKDLVARGNMVISKKLLMTDKEITFTKNGRTMTIMPGKPFFIVSDNLSYNFGNPQQAIDALLDPTEASTTFVYTEPMTGSFAEWLNQVHARRTNKNLKTTIGNAATAYRILSDLIKTDEGKEWIKSRFADMYSSNSKVHVDPKSKHSPDNLLNEIITLMNHFDAIDAENDKHGNDNLLVQELNKTLADTGFTDASQFPGIATVGFYTGSNAKYDRIFERVVEALAMAESMGTTGNSLSFVNTVSEDSPHVKELLRLTALNPNSKFKTGRIHGHVSYAKGENFKHNSGGRIFIEVASPESVTTALDPERTEVLIDAKLDTGVLKTTGTAAEEFDKARQTLATYTEARNATGEARKVQIQTNAYSKDTMKSLLVSSPGDTSAPNPAPKPKPSRSKIITEAMNAVKASRGSSLIMRNSIENLINDELKSVSDEAITSDLINSIIDRLINEETIHVLPINERNEGDIYMFTEDDIRKHFSDLGFDVNTITFNTNDAIVETSAGKFTISLVWKNNTVNIAKVLEKVIEPSTNSTPKSGKINVKIGSENKEVNITDSISSVLGNSQGLNLLEEKNTDAGDGNILSWTLARVIMVDESNGDTDISVAHTALNNYLQEHQELINDPTLFTIEDIVNLLTTVLPYIDKTTIETGKKLSSLSRNEVQKNLNNIIFAVAEYILSDSTTTEEEDPNACVIPTIKPF